MTVQASNVHPAQKPFYRRQGFWRVTLPVLSVFAALIAGIVVYNAYNHDSGPSIPPPNTGPVAPKPPKAQPNVKVDSAHVRPLVREFVMTAVARKNLSDAYPLVTKHLREGQSLKTWDTGAIPVVPYPIKKSTQVIFQPLYPKYGDFSHPNAAQIEVIINTPHLKHPNGAAWTDTFFVKLAKQNGHWLIDGWVPFWTAPIPTAP